MKEYYAARLKLSEALYCCTRLSVEERIAIKELVDKIALESAKIIESDLLTFKDFSNELQANQKKLRY